MDELLKMYGYNNSQSATKEEEDKEEPEDVEVEPETKDPEESGKEEKGEPTKDILKTRTDDGQLQEESPIVQKGEKRSSSTPPPAKKARSELAK